MRPSALLLLLLCPTVTSTSKCNYVTLVRCFINILDEWAWTLYELKDNVVTITSDQCRHLKELDKCIKDDLGEKHTCSHSEVVEVSNTVSDLLTHRRNSGSFLKSYYLLTYACSTEGQEILLHHRECLREEKIGNMTLAAGTYLSENFLNEDDDEICTVINDKLKEYVAYMKGMCDNEAAQIMCKSLQNMFKGLHADKLEMCELDCAIENVPKTEAEPAENEPVAEEVEPEQVTNVPVPAPSSPEGQVGEPKAAASLLTPLALIAILIRN